MKILITGCTGFIGSELLRTILMTDYADEICVIIRKDLHHSAQDRFAQMIKYWDKFSLAPDPEKLKRVKVIECDLLQDPLPLIDNLDLIFHTAASTELGRALDESRKANVFLTQKVLGIARKSENLKRFVHFSTAFVSGKRKGLVKEDDRFTKVRNPYEQSKREGEQCVKQSGLPFTILRPSIVVGDSRSGYIWKVKVLYSVIRMWLSGYVPRAPIDASAKVDIVPVDFVVNASMFLAEAKDSLGKAVHICSGSKAVSPMKILKSAVRNLEFDMPPISPQWAATILAHWPARKFVNHSLGEVLDTMKFHIPYLGMKGRTFDTNRADEILGSNGIVCPAFDEYGDALFEFLKVTSWGKKSAPLF